MELSFPLFSIHFVFFHSLSRCRCMRVVRIFSFIIPVAKGTRFCLVNNEHEKNSIKNFASSKYIYIYTYDISYFKRVGSFLSCGINISTFFYISISCRIGFSEWSLLFNQWMENQCRVKYVKIRCMYEIYKTDGIILCCTLYTHSELVVLFGGRCHLLVRITLFYHINRYQLLNSSSTFYNAKRFRINFVIIYCAAITEYPNAWSKIELERVKVRENSVVFNVIQALFHVPAFSSHTILSHSLFCYLCHVRLNARNRI